MLHVHQNRLVLAPARACLSLLSGLILAAAPVDLVRAAAPDGRPFSFVVETYTAAALQMALPKAP